MDSELAGLLEDITAVEVHGIDLIAAGLRALATDTGDHDPRTPEDLTQVIVSTLAGSGGADILTALATLIGDLTSTTNPALKHLPFDRAQHVAQLGKQAMHALLDPELHQAVADIPAAIEGIEGGDK
jgi:hypothetical protein